MAKIERAILSVTDKTGLVEFAGRLAAQGVELISTGGTARVLREAGLKVRDISDLTGFPEMLDGRVKTLHPKVHGGILHVRSNPAHVAAVKQHGILPIDMLVVNLYAFEKTASKPGAHFEEIIENIDIGGPSMVRSAAKNFQDVAIVTSAADYDAIAAEMEQHAGELSLQTKWRLAQKAFATTSAYDTAIANALAEITVDETFTITAGTSTSHGLIRKPARAPASRRRCACSSRRPWICAMARIRTRRRRCTAMARARAWPTAASCRAKNSATTTLSICRRPGIWLRNSASRSAPSSSTPTPAAPRRAAR